MYLRLNVTSVLGVIGQERFEFLNLPLVGHSQLIDVDVTISLLIFGLQLFGLQIFKLGNLSGKRGSVNFYKSVCASLLF